MFGYVMPLIPQMKVCEYEQYRAVYCGLCKQLGRQFGPFSRLTLSYDFTFLTLLHMAVNEPSCKFGPARCMLNPLKKCLCLPECEELSFSASTAMIMVYYKVLDNCQDGRIFEKLFSLFCIPSTKHAYNKAREKYPQSAAVMDETIKMQAEIERSGCRSADAAAEPSALALGGICKLLSDDPAKKRILERFGYLLGRYIYLVDALDDLEKDLKTHSYNPFLLRENISVLDKAQIANVRSDAKGSLYLTVGEIIKTYDLLSPVSFREILDNIVYLGLMNTVDKILFPKENDHK